MVLSIAQTGRGARWVKLTTGKRCIMKKLHAWLIAIMLIAGLGLVAPGPASASPYCGITWGSLAKTGGSASSAPIVDLRAGRHACFDRIVIDIRGEAAGYTVRYVNTVRAEGSGFAIPLRGAADLSIVVKAPAYDSRGNATYRPANRNELANVAGYTALRQVAFAGSFEGQTSFGLGVRGRLPFKVFTLAGPGDSSRLVIDVAHRW